MPKLACKWSVILLPLHSKCCDYRHEPAHSALVYSSVLSTLSAHTGDCYHGLFCLSFGPNSLRVNCMSSTDTHLLQMKTFHHCYGSIGVDKLIYMQEFSDTRELALIPNQINTKLAPGWNLEIWTLWSCECDIPELLCSLQKTSPNLRGRTDSMDGDKKQKKG